MRELAPEYRRRSTEEILDPVDMDEVVAALPTKGVTALLGVERDHEACHRSIVAERIGADYGIPIKHL